MSWSVSAWGKVPAVDRKLLGQFSDLTFLVPEERTVADEVAAVIHAALCTQTPESFVRVDAGGSLSKTSGALHHTITLEIRTLYGYVE